MGSEDNGVSLANRLPAGCLTLHAHTLGPDNICFTLDKVHFGTQLVRPFRRDEPQRRERIPILKPIVLALCAVGLGLVLACSSTMPTMSDIPGDQWAIRVTSTDGRFVGGLVLELTSIPTSASCLAGPEMFAALIIEKYGFPDDYVRDEAAVQIEGANLYADLSVGTCDHTLTLTGSIRGRRATGDVNRSTLIGNIRVGRFTAEKR
jgi:hypothetical protein